MIDTLINVKRYFSKRSNYLFILILAILGIGLILITMFNFPAYTIALFGIISIIIGAIRDMLNQSSEDIEAAQKNDSEEAFRKMTEEKMAIIDKKVSENNTLTERTQTLENEKKNWEEKQKIWVDFVRRGIIKEDDMIESLGQETFTVIYHFNKNVPKKYITLLPEGKKVMQKILDDLKFIPVSVRPGSFFFHVINTNALIEELRNPVELEAYIKKRVLISWGIVENKLRESNPKEYKAFKDNSARNWNLIYFLGNIFPANLRIGYLNYQNFDPRFLPYLARSSKKIKNVNKQKLNDVIHLASIEYFISFMPPTDREALLNIENQVKEELKIEKLFDYENIPESEWLKITSKLFDNTKAAQYAKTIVFSVKRVMPIIKEFL